MMNLLVFKEHLRSFYAKYGIYITPVWRFILAVTTFLLMNKMIGSIEILNNPVTLIVLGLICAFIPINAFVFISAIYMLAGLYTISVEITLVTLAFLLVMFLLCNGIKSGASLLLILTPIAFYFKIPYIIPLAMGLLGSIASAVPVAFGVIIYYILLYVKQNAAQISNTTVSSGDIQRYVQFIDSIVGNPMILLTILAFTITIIIVYLIRRMTVDHAWSIAIGAGAFVEIVILLMGDFIFDVSISVLGFLLSMGISVILVFILEFFVFAVDYTRTEYTQFEDDEYYYYVKAVPKIVVTTPEVKVQKYTVRKTKSAQANHSGKKPLH